MVSGLTQEKYYTIGTRVTANIYRKFREVCKIQGKSPSALIREFIFKEIRKGEWMSLDERLNLLDKRLNYAYKLLEILNERFLKLENINEEITSMLGENFKILKELKDAIKIRDK